MHSDWTLSVSSHHASFIWNLISLLFSSPRSSLLDSWFYAEEKRFCAFPFSDSPWAPKHYFYARLLPLHTLYGKWGYGVLMTTLWRNETVCSRCQMVDKTISQLKDFLTFYFTVLDSFFQTIFKNNLASWNHRQIKKVMLSYEISVCQIT